MYIPCIYMHVLVTVKIWTPTCRALFRKQLFCPGSLISPLLGAIDVMVLGVRMPCNPLLPDAK